MDDRNDFEVIIRINERVFRFNSVVLHHSTPNDPLDFVEVKRNGGFIINQIV